MKILSAYNKANNPFRVVAFIWGQIDKVRTFLLESVQDEDSFLRTLQIT